MIADDKTRLIEERLEEENQNWSAAWIQTELRMQAGLSVDPWSESQTGVWRLPANLRATTTVAYIFRHTGAQFSETATPKLERYESGRHDVDDLQRAKQSEVKEYISGSF